MKFTAGKLLCAGLLAVLMLSAVGCQQPITGSRVRSNLTPELDTLALTPEQHANRTTRTINTNMRGIKDDIDGLLFLDRPSRLSRWPVP